MVPSWKSPARVPGRDDELIQKRALRGESVQPLPVANRSAMQTGEGEGRRHEGIELRAQRALEGKARAMEPALDRFRRIEGSSAVSATLIPSTVRDKDGAEIIWQCAPQLADRRQSLGVGLPGCHRLDSPDIGLSIARFTYSARRSMFQRSRRDR